MAWASSCVAAWRRTSVSTSWPGASGRAGAFVLASYMVAYSGAWWAGGWSCNNPGYAAFFNRSSTTFDHSSLDASCCHLPVLLLAHEVELRGTDVAVPGDLSHLVHLRVISDRVVDGGLSK